MNKKIAHFFIGLPGAGKTTYIEQNLKRTIVIRDFFVAFDNVISADKIKESHPEYDPNNAHLLHQWSVEQAEKEIIELANQGHDNLIFDSGGINNNYSIRIMTKLKELGYYIKLIILDTPAHICLERINQRERKVPREDIIQKSFKMKECIIKQSAIADEVIREKFYKNDKLFLDMDGVIAAYECYAIGSTYHSGDRNVDYINNNMFEHAELVIPVMDVISENYKNLEDIFIISVSPNNKTNEEKTNFLIKKFIIEYSKKNLSQLSRDGYSVYNTSTIENWLKTNVYFIGDSKKKISSLTQIMQKHKLQRENVLYVDDLHEMIWDAVNLGINGVHPSKFLTMKIR
jgi:predicted kinase